MLQKEERRKKIIETAVVLFITNGFHGTPTSLIAKECGIATGTLFNYFKTKDILINEIFIEIKESRRKVILKDIDTMTSFKRKLNKIWENLIIWSLENENYQRFLNSFNNSYIITDSIKSEIKNNFSFLLSMFEEHIKEKQLKDVDAQMLILNFMGVCLFTKKYFKLMEIEYDKKISDDSFERYCRGIQL